MRRNLGVALTLLAVVSALVAGACYTNDADVPEPEGSDGSTGPSLTQRDGGEGGVEVEMTWVTSEYLESWGEAKAEAYGTENYILLYTKLDTHSGDLGKYDLVELTALRLPDGSEYQPLAWETTEGGSHHRSGILVFPRSGPDGTPLDATTVEVVMRDIAGVSQRVFAWEFTSGGG